ncbi:MAG: hypothetical protein ACYTG6_12115, partial [Planctomycetota bacterium]
MRRAPAAVWILAPLALGILYALAHPLLAPTPTLADVVPAQAVLTQRFRDLESMDEAWFRPPTAPKPSDLVGPNRNLPGLAGVDRQRPFHLVFLPPGPYLDPTMMIFPVADEDALRARFTDPDYFVSKGHVRRAQFLAVAGNYAAVSADRAAVRHLGEGGITAADLGEDHAIAAHVPALVRFALLRPHESPWRSVLDALGVDPTLAPDVDPGRPVEIPAGRLDRVHAGWKTARM